MISNFRMLSLGPAPRREPAIKIAAIISNLCLFCACSGSTELSDSEAVNQGRGANSEAAIFFVEGFDSEDFRKYFTMHRGNKHVQIYDGNKAFNGRSLLVSIPKGAHFGANFSYVFRDRAGNEPESLYSRYYVRFSSSWSSGVGGKLPGPSGTYNRAGWGGRRSNGTNGWSARMGFNQSWWEGETQLSFYTYHADTRTKYGDGILWDKTKGLIFNSKSLGSLEKEKWYCVESFVKLNAPGKYDGILRGWVNGELALDERNIRFRDTDQLKIEKYWFNVYYGGSATAPHDMKVYFDELALSTSRIGCAESSAGLSESAPVH